MANGADDFSVDTLATNWATQAGEATGGVSGGAWRILSGSPEGHRRTRETYLGDHYSEAKVLTTAVFDLSVRVRCHPSQRSYYAAGMDPNDFGGAIYRIWKVSSAGGPTVWTLLSTHSSQAMAVNDVIRLTASGSTLTLTVNGTSLLTTTDGELTGGAPGLGGASSSGPIAALDNWSAADMGGGPPPWPNPLLLPQATTTQHPLVSAYTALNVPAMAAGASYLDPTTGVRVHKLTGPSFPLANTPGFAHDYAEGGAEVSLPHTGTTRTILVRDQNSLSWWLIDFTPGSGVSNPRLLTGTLAPWIDIAFSFSQNPATPYYAYVCSNNAITRFDVRTMTAAPGGGWPVTETGLFPCWLQQSKNDEFFVWMRGVNGPDVVGYQPSTTTKKMRTGSGGLFGTEVVNEPRVDREGRYVAFVTGTGTTGHAAVVFWDWLTDAMTWSAPRLPPNNAGGTGIPFAHNASLRRRFAGVQWDGAYPPPFWQLDPSVPNSQVVLAGGTCSGIALHCGGNWVQVDAALDDQWFIDYMYGGLESAPPFDTVAWLFPGGVILATANGERRALVHPYSVSATYARLAFAKYSPDGAYVLFNSDMNGGARTDVFLAEVPAGPDTVPPSAPGTLTATPQQVPASAVLAWGAATDAVGIAGYFVERNTVELPGMPITALSFTDTGLALDTPYSYRVRAIDLGGNRGPYSNTATVTVPSADTTPPTAPSSLTATPISSFQINCVWSAATDNVGVTAYSLERSTGAGTFAFAPVAGMPIPGTAWNDGGLVPGTTYRYRVRARDAAGNWGGYSSIVDATTFGAPDITPPTAPANLVVTLVSATQASLVWDAATDAVGVAGYFVERNGIELPGMPITTTQYTDAGLTPGAVYTYRVRAVDAAGNRGAYSNLVTVPPPPPPPTAPAVWPTALPTRFLQDPGATEQPPDIMIETQMDAGPPKARRRYTAGYRIVTGSIVLTHAQRQILDDFYVTTLQGGALTFDWIHPITSQPATFRFLPQPNGLRYRQKEVDIVDLVVADLQLRIMP